MPIAIIGMACRFSGDVDTPTKLWEACAEGKSAWSKIPASRFNLEGIYHPNGAKADTVCFGAKLYLNAILIEGSLLDECHRRPFLERGCGVV
jgi:acyl transferase domain-containing protein